MSEPNSPDTQYSSNKSTVMIGCGCRTVKDVVAFMKEKRIENVELAWADEMGLWHNETVPVSELTYAHLQEGVPCKDGKFLIPDPLSARFAPLTQPNTMIFTCNPSTSRSALKTKQLSPGWIEMISKKLMENDKRIGASIERMLSADILEEPSFSPTRRGSTEGDSGRYGSGGGDGRYASSDGRYGSGDGRYASGDSYAGSSSPTSPYGSSSPRSSYDSYGGSGGGNYGGTYSNSGVLSFPSSSSSSPPSSYGSSGGGFSSSSPPSSYSSSGGGFNVGNSGDFNGSNGLDNSGGISGSGGGSNFIEWKLVRNDGYGSPPPTIVFPPSPSSEGGTPPGSVPGSPCMPSSPHSPVPDIAGESDNPNERKIKNPAGGVHVPPLLRPRQIHPTKANKLGISKPVKKRRNTEHLYCRHCGTTETPEWRRGPDGRKSLCNACGLYFSKMIKRETLVVPQGRRVAIDALLNP